MPEPEASILLLDIALTKEIQKHLDLNLTLDPCPGSTVHRRPGASAPGAWCLGSRAWSGARSLYSYGVRQRRNKGSERGERSLDLVSREYGITGTNTSGGEILRFSGLRVSGIRFCTSPDTDYARELPESRRFLERANLAMRKRGLEGTNQGNERKPNKKGKDVVRQDVLLGPGKGRRDKSYSTNDRTSKQYLLSRYCSVHAYSYTTRCKNCTLKSKWVNIHTTMNGEVSVSRTTSTKTRFKPRGDHLGSSGSSDRRRQKLYLAVSDEASATDQQGPTVQCNTEGQFTFLST
ncbi:hypothetical protein L228DRAFT_236974 [Xylona heveae TC161]|uniref:Uncharacterized protein n=1 Tax=Xylona heveae (strain CBS 132557 / TC161) TaxID=1328760 RepID=A0A165HW01_XYLHT|nr:hypothetical protein L228DRAFT_236974 [Xylona heveae TC161]KZF24000.1 hypothetical protein L228DRAFT_236974 [Xylona heveae TC161]